MALLRAIDLRATGGRRQSRQAAAPSPSATAAASRFDVVSRMAEASTSCSACASMSAARCARIAIGGDDQDLGGPGDEVDAHLARQQLLRRGHVDVARARRCGPPRHRARAEGERRDGLRAAHLEDVRDAQQRRRAEDLRHRPRARPRRCSARPPPAPESPSSAAWRAADSGPAGMYAATVSSGRTICPSRRPGANSRAPLRAASGISA